MGIADRLTLYLYYSIRGLVAVAFVLFLVFGNWIDAFNTALIFLVMMAPAVLKDRFSVYLPFGLEVAIVTFVFTTLFLGSLQDYYEKFALWDGVLHFQSGILLGIVGFVLVYTLNEQSTKKIYLSPGFISFFAVTFSLAVSVVWEIYEYTFDILLGYNMQESGLPDTMGDMIVNAIGALIVGLLGYLWMRKRKKLPFTPSDISGVSDYASLHRERD